MSERKAVRILIEYDDGYKEGAAGDDAEQILRAINGAFVMQSIHGGVYKGPQMKEIKGDLETVSPAKEGTLGP